MAPSLLFRTLTVACLPAAALLGAGSAMAATVCTGPGYPPGCVEVEAAPLANPTPGVGYGAPGAGLRPTSGPGVSPNYGGPANYHPAAGPGAGPNVRRPMNRQGLR